jgi:phosphatidylglycerophosphate synthase
MKKILKEQLVIPQRRPQEYLVNKYYADPIAIVIVKMAYRLGLSPNLLTVISLICGVLAAGSFLTQRWVVGAILLQFHLFFDLADGTLARLANKQTEFGAKLDQISDEIVRFLLFPSIAIVSPVSLWAKIVFVVTIYLDVVIIHFYVLPFIRKNQLLRSPWKKWFLDQGIIPGFDIFLVFVLISIFALIKRFDLLMYIVIVGKNLDWMYRVWECWRSVKWSKKAGDSTAKSN